MSIVNQSLSPAVIPLRHTLLSVIEVTEEEWESGIVVDSAYEDETPVDVTHPGQSLARWATTDFIGCVTHPRLTEAYAGLLVMRARTGIPFQNGSDVRWDTKEDQIVVGWNTTRILKRIRTMSREQAIRYIAPMFIYARSHIKTAYDPSNIKDRGMDEWERRIFDKIAKIDDIIYLDSISLAQGPVKTEVIPRSQFNDVTHKFVQLHKPIEGVHGTWRLPTFIDDPESLRGEGDSPVDVATTSTGILFRANGEIDWEDFHAVDRLYPADPYAANAPSPRSVIVRLMQELHSQSDENLVGIILALVNGITTNVWKGTVGGVTQWHASNIWEIVFPGESPDAPIFVES